MPSILHRYSIDAPPARVRELIATKEGVRQWWTGQPVAGNDDLGGEISVYFRQPAEGPSATFEIAERTSDQIVWRCLNGPADWIDTRITFKLNPRTDGGTTLLFTHSGWQHESEFMGNCSTNWAAYLRSLKTGAEGHGFSAYPDGEMSRYD
jgi:uncharacterized protein YndB with AHSA1/START domain